MNHKVLRAAAVAVVVAVAGIAYAQNLLTVVGKVTDAGKQPLAGVEVTEKGAPNNRTVSAKNGNYSIKAARGRTLVFSLAGYVAAERTVGSAKIDVTLHKAGDEVTKAGKAKDSRAFAFESAEVIGYLDNPTPVYIIDMDDPNSDPITLDRSLRPYGSSSSSRPPAPAASAPLPPPSRPSVTYDGARAEEYSSFAENRFKDAKTEPLSTFSLDVDVASYSNVRRIINQGQKPPKDAVRIEQLINYFSYDYQKPKGKHPVNIITETQASPWNKDHLLVRIAVKAKDIPSEKIPPSNFVFLIDVSGSMDSPNRLPLVVSSLKLLTNNLRKTDRVAIVTYADGVAEPLPSTTGDDRQKIIEALDGLKAGGGTAGGAGIQRAYDAAQKNFIKDGNNRIILCTDGDFNIGISSPKELENFIEKKRKTGVYLTVLGYGMGNYKDNRLQILSQKGNGNHAYIDNLQEANRVLVQEFGSTMYAVAKDVKMQVEFNPAYVNAYRLVGYESRLLNKEDFNDDTKDAGELGAGHRVTVFYEVIPAGVKNAFGGVDDLKYQKTESAEQPAGVMNNELMNVKVRYKPLDSDKSVLMETPVAVASKDNAPSADFTFAAAVAMFGHLLRDSDFKGASSYDEVVKLAKKSLGDDPQGYRREFVRLAEAMKQLEK